MILVVGATGFLGMENCRRLRERDESVRAIAVGDVAAAAAACVNNPKAHNRTFELGGPRSAEPPEVVAIFEEPGTPRFTLEQVSEAELRRRREVARDPASGVDSMTQSIDALMLGAAVGTIVDMSEALAALPIELTPVRAYARRLLGR